MLFPATCFDIFVILICLTGLAEKLFRQLETTHERFEVRLMTLDMISRLIGLHQLILLNFYPYIQRFLQPHQKGILLRVYRMPKFFQSLLFIFIVL